MEKYNLEDYVDFEDGVILRFYPNGKHTNRKNVGDFVIPSTIRGEAVVEIGDGAFKDTVIKSLDVPNTVKVIGENAFYESSIQSIDLKEGLVLIKGSAFEQSGLLSIKLPKSLNMIEEFTFAGSPIEEIDFGGLEEIPYKAFAWTNITKLVIPSHLKEIYESAFEGCSMESIEILSKGLIIKDFAFTCNLISRVKGWRHIERLGYGAFSNNQLVDIDISNIKILGDDAFKDNPVAKIHLGDRRIKKMDEAGYEDNFGANKGFGDADRDSGTYVYDRVSGWVVDMYW